MKKKKKISVQTIIEVMIRAVFFIIYPALFSTAFTGIKLIVEQITQRASLQWNSFVQTLVVLLVFTIVFGRFFCGFACAFGTWGDFVYFISSMIRKKRKKKPLKCFSKAGKILRYLKYVVLIVVLLLCIKGYSSAVAIHSPFSAFSRFLVKDGQTVLSEQASFYWLQQEWHWNQDFSAVSYAQWEQYFP